MQDEVIIDIENPQESDDCISRQNIIDTYKSCADMLSDEELKGADLVMEWVNNASPVTQKSGKWITTRTFMHDGEYYCDRCKCDAPNNEKWDYCPNCGAKMVEPQESEE